MSDIVEFESRLYPQESSEVGFLLPGQRLEEVLSSDAAIAAHHGVTLYQLGCILERIVLLSLQGQTVIDSYEILPSINTCGYQKCPFEELDLKPITYGRGPIQIRRIDTGEIFVFEALVAHLVKEHGFCEGPGTKYRLDLETAIRFFAVQPGIDYTPKFEMVRTWKESLNGPSKSANLESLSIAKYTCGPFVALVLPSPAPSKTDWIVSGTSISNRWREKLNREMEQRLNSKFDLEFLGEEEFPEAKRSRLEAEAETKMAAIANRIEQFANGVIEPGLVIVILGDLEADHPENGMSAVPLVKTVQPDPILLMMNPDMKPETHRLAQFKIPSLQFEITSRIDRFPCVIQYKLSVENRWI